MVAFFTKISRAVSRQKRRMALQSELAMIGAAERSALFSDLGLSETAMGQILSGSMDDSLLDRMLLRVGVDPETLSRCEPQTAREMQRTCAQCTEWGRCTSEFDNDTMRESVPRYCPNRADILDVAARGLVNLRAK
jgi:hypothetical protein